MKAISIVSFILMAGALLGLIAIHSLFSSVIIVIVVQALAVALMLWARIVFGRRSFHAAASPTEGGLVTTGPYRYVRHPIYTAVVLFVFAGVASHISWASGGLALLALLGAVGRMLIEEKLLVERYPEYSEYASKTCRMIPYVF